MTRTRDLADRALASEQPAEVLEALVRGLLPEGQTREAIAAERDALVADLRARGQVQEGAEENVLEIQDRLCGWRLPDVRLELVSARGF